MQTSDAERATPNPYAPPAAASKRRRVVPSPVLTVFITLQLVGLPSYVALYLGLGSPMFSVVIVIAEALLTLVWLHQQWARLPARLQFVKAQGVTPAGVVWRNLIPLYGVY